MADDGEASWRVEPRPGFCVKFKDCGSGGNKLFINICVCDPLPPPTNLINEDELAAMLDEGNSADYQVPMSVSDVQKSADHNGDTCLKIDALINARFFESTVKDSELFRVYLVTVACGLIECKCPGFELMRALHDNRWTILKNKKYMGQPQPQHIRQKPQGRKIVDLDENDNTVCGKPTNSQAKTATTKTNNPKPTVVTKSAANNKSAAKDNASMTKSRSTPAATATTSKPPGRGPSGPGPSIPTAEPDYTLMSRVDPTNSGRRQLHCAFHLCNVRDVGQIQIDLSANELRLACTDSAYTAVHLWLPVRVHVDDVTECSWNEHSHVLTLVVPVVKGT